jgi:hypothetical protein
MVFGKVEGNPGRHWWGDPVGSVFFTTQIYVDM